MMTVTWQTNGCKGFPEYDAHTDDYDGPRANVIKYSGESYWSWIVYHGNRELFRGQAPTASKARAIAERFLGRV